MYTIARDAQVSNATVYKLWPNRSALLADALVARFPVPEPRTGTGGNDPVAELSTTTHNLINALGSDLGRRYPEIRAAVYGAELHDQLDKALFTPWLNRITDICREGVAIGVFRGAMADSIAGVHVAAAALAAANIPLTERTTSQVATTFVDLIINGVLRKD
ncbi:hypothetical protein GCM10009619_41860 [Williamsia maris]